jgi:hypothetical protein
VLRSPTTRTRWAASREGKAACISTMTGQRQQPTPKPRPAAGPSNRAGYHLVGLDEDDAAAASSTKPLPPLPHVRQRRYRAVAVAVAAVVGGLLVCLGLKSAWDGAYRWGSAAGAAECPCQKPGDVPQYFQTSPQIWPGPTATGKAPFLAQTRTFASTGSYVPNTPLQTAVPITGMAEGDESIFRMMGCVVIFPCAVCLLAPRICSC